jgi:hypothetical protein
MNTPKFEPLDALFVLISLAILMAVLGSICKTLYQ